LNRHTPLAVLAAAVALAACTLAEAPGGPPTGPAPAAAAPAVAPRFSLDPQDPLLRLTTREDFLAGTLDWGVDVARAAAPPATLARTPVGLPKDLSAVPARDKVAVQERTSHAAVFAHGIHLISGGQVAGVISGEVAGLGPDGAIGVLAANQLVVPRTDHAMVATDGRLYVLGGVIDDRRTQQLVPVASLEWSDLDAKSGLPGPFTLVDGVLPRPLSGSAVALVGGTIYLIGGSDDQSADRAEILRAAVLPDGSLGPFTATTAALPVPCSGARAVAVADSVLVVGGSAGGAPLRSVLRFTPGPDGDVTRVEELRQPLGTGRSRPAVAVAAGQLFVLGGDVGGSAAPLTEVSSLVDSAGGPDLGGFDPGPLALEPTVGAAASTNGVEVLVSGGVTGVTPIQAPVLWRLGSGQSLVEPAAAPKTGRWRRVLDLGRVLQIRTVRTVGTAADGGAVRLAWRAAISASDWGPLSTPEQVLGIGAVTDTVTVTAPGGAVASRWFELVLDLDDSGTAQLPASSVDGVELVLAPTSLGLVAPPGGLPAGVCTAVTLELRDGAGLPFPTGVDFPVAVSVDGGAAPVPTTVHATSACGAPLAGKVTIPAGQATATLWVKGGTVGTVTGTATPDDAAVPPASSQAEVVAGPVAAVAFPAGSPPAAATSLVPFTVQVRLTDPAGNPADGRVDLAIAPGTGPAGAHLGGTVTLNSVGGLAGFPNLTLDKAGAYRFRAVLAGTAITATSAEVAVAPGAPAGLAFSQLPPATAAGMVIASPVVVDLQDAAGNVATNAPPTSVTLALPGPVTAGALGGTLVQSTAAGRATFANLTLSPAGSYTLQASATGLTPATSSPITVFRVAFGLPPGGLVSGACTAVSLDLRDGLGGPVAAPADFPVGLSVQSGPGPVATTLSASSDCAASSSGVGLVVPAGQSTRTFWARGGSAGALTLSASPVGSAAAPFTGATTVTAGPAAAIAFQPGSPPAQVSALAQFNPQVKVTDAAGNPVDGAPVGIAVGLIDLPKGATLGGIVSTTTGADGVATFSNLTLDKAGTYRLLATVTGAPLAGAGGTVEVVPGAPVQLLFAAYPTVVVVNRAFDTAVAVELRDAAGNRCTNAPATQVTLGLQGGAGGALLGGTTALSTAAGVATFGGLSIPQQGTFQLTAASAGLPSASSGNVEVRPQGSGNPPVKMAWSVWPASVPLNTCSSEFRVEALDADDQRISPVPADYVTVFVAGAGADAASVTVYSDPVCATPAASVTIGAAGVASFYVKGAASKVLTVAADATLSGNRRIIQKDFQVGAAPPAPPAPSGPKPLNGWSCGTTAPGGGSPGLLALIGLGALLLRPRRAPRPARLAAAWSLGLALALAAAPAAAQTAPATGAAPAAKPKPKPVKPADVPLPPPPKGLTRTPAAEPTPPPAPASPVAAGPRKPRDPRPSVAVLNVEGTLTGEKLDLAALTDVLATTVDEAGWFRVVSSRDVTAVLALERQKELLGCSADQACIAELAGALGVEYVLSASVGKVGEAYVVSGRMVEARRGAGVARASTNASAAGLVRAVRATARKLLEGFRAGRPEAEQARLVLPGRDQRAEEEVDGAEPGRLSLRLAAVGGLAPGAEAGAQRSVGVEAGLGWRLGEAWELTVTGVGGPTLGGRVGVTRTLLDGGLRLSAGLRAAAWPGASAFGGGPVVELALPLGRRAALFGFAAAEGYGAKAAQGSWAVLGGAGLQLRL